VLVERDPSRIPTELAELHETVDRGYREARNYLTALRSARPVGRPLWSEVERVAEDFQARGRVRVELSARDGNVGMPPAATHEITQIIREALTNAERHGAATEVRVHFAAEPSGLTLTIRDNGTGFPPNGRLAPDGVLPESATPWSIRERVATLGGTLQVWTRPGEGAEVRVSLPTSGGGPP
jgi:signal transduction histidine kinase